MYIEKNNPPVSMQDLPAPPTDYRDYSKEHAKMLSNVPGSLEGSGQGTNHTGIKSEDTNGETKPTPGGFLDISPQLPTNHSIANTMASQALTHNSFAPYPPSYLNSYPQMDSTPYHPAAPGQGGPGNGSSGGGGLGYPFSMNPASNLSPYTTGYGQGRMGYPGDPYQNPVTSLMNSKSIDR